MGVKTGDQAQKMNFSGLKHCKNGLMTKQQKMLEAIKQGKEVTQDPYMHKTFNMTIYMKTDEPLNMFYASQNQS